MTNKSQAPNDKQIPNSNNNNCHCERSEAIPSMKERDCFGLRPRNDTPDVCFGHWNFGNWNLFVIWILLFGILPNQLFAQKKIQILNADRLQFSKIDGQKVRRLIGNVRFQQKDVILQCDSAYSYTGQKLIKAFGHVHIRQGDTLNIFSDLLEYDSDARRAILKENVRMKSQKMLLTTDILQYDLNSKVATYTQGGKIKSKRTTLTSQKGYYFTQKKMMYFRDNVVLVHPDYQIFTDTLGYNINTNIAHFFEYTTIKSQENTIYCNGGWYDTNNDIALFTKKATLINASQKLTADTIKYNQQDSTGEAINKVTYIDTAQNIIIKSNYAQYYGANEYIMATQKALLISIIDDDSLFITADTLKSYIDTNEHRIFFGYYDVKIFKENLQGVCDSLVYSFKDSSFHLFNEPIIWSNESQMWADTIIIKLRNKKLDKINLYQRAFIASKSDTSDTLLFNQIRGKNIYGYFKDKELHRMLVEGNGQSIYYVKDDSGAYIGLNKAECSNMWIYFKDNKTEKVTFLTKPEATFHPIQHIKPEDFMLKGFFWQEEKRPKSKGSLLGD